MKRISTFILIIIVLNISNVLAATIYVDTDATGNDDGTSWTDAYDSFQDALDAATSGDEIWVAEGTYKPSYDYGLGGGSRYYHFRMINGVDIYGGFAGTETLLSQRDIENNETILSGDIGTPGDNSDNCYHVFYHPSGLNLDATAALDGFTIAGGNADGSSYPHFRGGGMYNYSSSPTVTNVTISNNSADTGGGMDNSSSSPTLTNVTISYNSAYSGGGMYNYSSSPTVTNVTISNNYARHYGSGMYNYSSSPTLSNVTISNNSADYDGGGMYNYYFSSPTLTNVTISTNYARYNGGGMYNWLSSSPELTNVTISNNSADYDGGGMYNYDSSSPELTNVTISNNSADNNGGGMYNWLSSSPELTNVTISNNSADYDGGGMYNYDSSSPKLTNVTISNNSADYGGGMYSWSSSPTLTNVTISNNSADNNGGGMYNYDSSSPTLTNVTISNNSAAYGGGMLNNSSSPTINNSIIWENEATNDGNQIFILSVGTTTLNYSCYADGIDNVYNDGGTFTPDAYCITSNPKFADACNADYRIVSNSPCVDEGNNTYNTEIYDIRGEDRIQNTTIDMGAYEWTSGTDPALIVSTDATDDISSTTATGNGEITNTGGADADERGFLLWGYDDADKETCDAGVTKYDETGSFGIGTFDASLTSLTPNTRYNIRAYAENSAGTGYGDRDDFWTLAATPSAPTVDNATLNTLNVTINTNGNPASVDYVIQELNTNRYVQSNGTLGTTPVWQTRSQWGSKTVTGLTSGSEYRFRVKARNNDTPALETNYSAITLKKTLSNLPTIYTDDIRYNGESSAKSGGTIEDEGASAITQKGIVWNTSGNPTLEDNEGYTEEGSGDEDFISIMTNLELNEQYYVRAYATNNEGTGYGEQKTYIFRLIPTLPEWGLIIFGSLIAVFAVRKIIKIA